MVNNYIKLTGTKALGTGHFFFFDQHSADEAQTALRAAEAAKADFDKLVPRSAKKGENVALPRLSVWKACRFLPGILEVGEPVSALVYQEYETK